MKKLILISCLFLIVLSIGSCGRKNLIYHGSTNEYKPTLNVWGKKYEQQKRYRAIHNARRAAKL